MTAARIGRYVLALLFLALLLAFVNLFVQLALLACAL